MGSASANGASESESEARANVNAAASQQKKRSFEDDYEAGIRRITSLQQKGKKQLKLSDSKDKLLAKHERTVAAIDKAKTLQDLCSVGKISTTQLLEAAMNPEKDFDMSKIRETAKSNAANNHMKDKNARQKNMDDMWSTGKANYKLVTDAKCDPFNDTQQHQAPAVREGYLHVPIIDIENDANVITCFQAISHNMNDVGETPLDQAYNAVAKNMAMFQLACLTNCYRDIHKELDTETTLHGALFKLASKAGFKQAKSESYFKAMVLASETYHKLANTFHLLRYATISISTWKQQFRTIEADLYGQGVENRQWRAMLLRADENENKDIAESRIDNFLAQK